jgi:hypothetical protein
MAALFCIAGAGVADGAGDCASAAPPSAAPPRAAPLIKIVPIKVLARYFMMFLRENSISWGLLGVCLGFAEMDEMNSNKTHGSRIGSEYSQQSSFASNSLHQNFIALSAPHFRCTI